MVGQVVKWVVSSDSVRVGILGLDLSELMGPEGIDATLAWLSTQASIAVSLFTAEELAAVGVENLSQRALYQRLLLAERPLMRKPSVPDWLANSIARFGGNDAVFIGSGSGLRAATAAAWALLRSGHSVADAFERVSAALERDLSQHATVAGRVRDYAAVLDPGQAASYLTPIPTSALRRCHLPPPLGSWWHQIIFSTCFDRWAPGEAPMREIERVSETRERFYQTGELVVTSVDEARACGFEHWRAWRWEGEEPTALEHRFMWALVEWMRPRIARA